MKNQRIEILSYGTLCIYSTLEYRTLDTTHNHNTHRTTSKKHRHHDLPRPPASSGFNFTGECDRRMSRDRYRSPQHGDAIFSCKTNFCFILLTIILYAADRRARGQKVCFFSEYLCFLFGCCVESTRTDPSYPSIYFLPMPPKYSSCFGMISDERGRAP